MRPDEIIDALAATQHGVVARAQLLTAGISRQAIDRRVAAGRLVAVHTGVYLTRGHVRSMQARVAAACLAAGPGAAASHRCAGRLLGMPVGTAPIEIIVPVQTQPKLRGVIIHRRPDLAVSDIAQVGGVRVTGPARTLIDLAGVLAETALATALDEALFRRLVVVDDIARRLAELGRQGRKGAGHLARLLDERADSVDRPQTGFERRLFAVLRSAGLPLPTPQFEVRLLGGRRCFLDFAYGDVLFAIEADSYRHHSTRSDWSRDHVRNRELTAMGWRILPATWDDLARPGPLLAAVARGLRVLPRVAG